MVQEARSGEATGFREQSEEGNFGGEVKAFVAEEEGVWGRGGFENELGGGGKMYESCGVKVPCEGFKLVCGEVRRKG